MPNHVPDQDRPLLLGLIGSGIAASRTPWMHMSEAQAQGLDCVYRILDIDAPQRQGLALGDLLQAARAMGFDGLNVTHPFKVAVLDHLTHVAPSAQAVGAANTILFRDSGLEGHNTDGSGFVQAFRQSLADAPCGHVLLLGAGGAGAAIAAALTAGPATRVSIHDVDPAQSLGLAQRIGANAGANAWASATAVSDVAALFRNDPPDGVVNATPMGMAAHPGTALDPALLTPHHWVADIVYLPLETELLRQARTRGCRVMNGSGMAVFQAADAFRLFTGRAADPDRMRATFDAFDPTDG